MLKKRSIPNMLTAFRLIAVPFFVAAYFLLPNATGAVVALTIFVLASLSDWLDGWLARKWQVESSWGKCFDPIADKVLVIAALFMIVWQEGQVLLPAMLIALREVVVSGLREYVANTHGELNVSHIGKAKTTLQMLAISIFVIIPALPLHVALWLLDGPAIIFMWVVAALTVATGLDYLRKAMPYLRNTSDK
mgnify:CR=1 FL=1